MTGAPRARDLLEPIQALHRQIRRAVVRATEEQSVEALATVSEDGEGDAIYAIDRVSEAELVQGLSEAAERVGGLVLVAEGLPGGLRVLPEGTAADQAPFLVIADPIDGTRGLMYQKRSAWVLTGVAPNRGATTRLRDIELAVQTELPLVKQHLSDELWAVRGGGVHAARHDRLTDTSRPLELKPSGARTIEQGYAMLSRFFPGARDTLASLDEELVEALLGPPKPGKAACFEDQYASSGGQLYELMAGHDRFNADLRPLLESLLAERGSPLGLCCHPYDLCTALIAEEAGVILTLPDGSPLDAPLNVEADVAWVGYANRALQRSIEPLLQRALRSRGLLATEEASP